MKFSRYERCSFRPKTSGLLEENRENTHTHTHTHTHTLTLTHTHTHTLEVCGESDKTNPLDKEFVTG